MEVDQTYQANITAGGDARQLTVTPFMVEQELRFKVTGEGLATEFYAGETGRLVSTVDISEDLELAIGDWIDGQYE